MTEADKKIVVCHVTTVHPSRDPRIFEKECRTLVQAGYEVHLVAQHPRDEVLEGVQIHALPTPRSRIDRATRIKRCAREWVERIGPRIVHFHDPELITLGSSLRRQGRVVVYDVHENTYDQILHKPYIPRLLRPLAATAYRWVERRHLRGLATVHVLDTIAQRYPQPRVTVRNLPMIQTAAAEMPVKDFGARPIRLIYAGAVSRTRGGMTMLHLAEDLDRTGVDFQLEIIGICRDAALQAEMKQFVDDDVILGLPV